MLQGGTYLRRGAYYRKYGNDNYTFEKLLTYSFTINIHLHPVIKKFKDRAFHFVREADLEPSSPKMELFTTEVKELKPFTPFATELTFLCWMDLVLFKHSTTLRKLHPIFQLYCKILFSTSQLQTIYLEIS